MNPRDIQIRNKRLIIFIIFLLILFAKECIFHYYIYHSILISSLFTNPSDFIFFYLAKIIMPLFIGAFIFVSSHLWWTFIISFFIDFWCVSNLIYYKTYDSLLTIDSILLANNMEGAWSSILPYLDFEFFSFFIITFAWVIIVLFLYKTFPQKKNRLACRCIILASIILGVFYNILMIGSSGLVASKDQNEFDRLVEELNISIPGCMKKNTEIEKVLLKLRFIPFCDYILQCKWGMFDVNQIHAAPLIYVKRHSIISYLPASIISHMFLQLFKVELRSGELLILDTNDINTINKFTFNIVKGNCEFTKDNLILILVESLESWAIEKDISGVNVMPCLREFKMNDHVLYIPKLKSQTVNGNSGDGQMIINTGLLPIEDGVACMNYSDNQFPNFAHSFIHSSIINPWPHIWNQDTMSVRYGYQSRI